MHLNSSRDYSFTSQSKWVLPSKCCQDALWQKQRTGHVHRQLPLRENT